MRIAHVAMLLVASWCVMVTTHEVGHLIGGWISGATLKACDLLPWHLPYSIHSPNPYPLVTLWGGPILGVVIPVLIAQVIRQPATWFIAYFCVLANGLYLAVAWFSADRHLDTPRLLEAGTPPVMLAIYSCVTIGWGYHGFRKSLKRTWNK